ncbi:MAG: type I restriction-modification system subunit M N-terminal domain-containing protein, partial [Fulvivirga sp.]
MFEQTFKNIDDVLWKDAGADSELDYIGQTSWIMFLRYLDDLESEKADIAALEGKTYEYILEEEYRWSSWAIPKNSGGEYDRNKAKIGDDLIEFVDRKLFPYLASFRNKTEDLNTIENKVG